MQRFLIASASLFLIGALSRRRLTLPRRHYGLVMLQGMFLFCANYYFVYFGTGYITSGLVAVLFTTLVFINSVNEWLFFRTPLDSRVIVAGLLGLGGIAMIFWAPVFAPIYYLLGASPSCWPAPRWPPSAT